MSDYIVSKLDTLRQRPCDQVYVLAVVHRER